MLFDFVNGRGFSLFPATPRLRWFRSLRPCLDCQRFRACGKHASVTSASEVMLFQDHHARGHSTSPTVTGLFAMILLCIRIDERSSAQQSMKPAFVQGLKSSFPLHFLQLAVLYSTRQRGSLHHLSHGSLVNLEVNDARCLPLASARFQCFASTFDFQTTHIRSIVARILGALASRTSKSFHA